MPPDGKKVMPHSLALKKKKKKIKWEFNQLPIYGGQKNYGDANQQNSTV